MSGYIKLLYPDGLVRDEELQELGYLTYELRNRIGEHQHFMELVHGGRTVEFPHKRLGAMVSGATADSG